MVIKFALKCQNMCNSQFKQMTCFYYYESPSGMIIPFVILHERCNHRNETLYDAMIKPCSWNIP